MRLCTGSRMTLLSRPLPTAFLTIMNTILTRQRLTGKPISYTTFCFPNVRRSYFIVTAVAGHGNPALVGIEAGEAASARRRDERTKSPGCAPYNINAYAPSPTAGFCTDRHRSVGTRLRVTQESRLYGFPHWSSQVEISSAPHPSSDLLQQHLELVPATQIAASDPPHRTSIALVVD